MIDFDENTTSTLDYPEESTPPLAEQVFDYYAAAIDTTPEEVRRSVESGNSDMVRYEAKTKALDGAQRTRERTISDLLEAQPTMEEAQAILDEVRANTTFGDFIAPDVSAMLSEGSTFSAAEKRITERVVAAERLIQEQREKRSSTFGSGFGYFLDTAISDTVHSPQYLVTGKLKGMAREAASLFYADLTKDEFETRFNALMDEAADQGFFSEENPMYLDTFLRLASEYASGSEARAQTAFEVFDTVTLGIGGLMSSGGKGGTSARQISKMSSRAKASEQVLTKIDNGIDDITLPEGTATEIEIIGKNDDYFAGPGLEVARDAEMNNVALRIITESNWGALVEPERLAAIKDDLIDNLRAKNKAYKRREVNYDIVVGKTGLPIGRVYLAKRGGELYKTAEGAKKFADRIGGEVVEQVHEGSRMFLVRKEYNIPTEGLADPTNINEVAGGLLSRIMSTTARTTKELDAKLKRGESAGVRAIYNIGKDYKKARRKVSKDEVGFVNAIFRALGEDPKYSYRNAAPTVEEFAQIWGVKHGEPSDELLEYYKSVRDLTDLDYYLTADEMLRAAINNKEDLIRLDNGWYRGRVVPNTLDPDTPIFQEGVGMVKFSDLDPELAVIREIKDSAFEPEGIGKVKYVTSANPVTRRLYHTDVLPYRAGGSRKYVDTYEFFLKQERSPLKLAGGLESRAKPTTFMAVRFEQEAMEAVSQINNIVRVINREGVTAREIDNIIKANNSWNTSIEDIADLQSFADEFNLDLTKEVSWAPDKERLVDADIGWAGEETVGSSFWSAKARGERPLLGFGGDELETVDPTIAIERDFIASVSRHGLQNYLNAAVEGWAKAAEEYVDPTTGKKINSLTNAEEVKGLSAYQKVLRGIPSPISEVGRKLTQEQNTIKFIMSNTTAQVERERAIMRGFVDWVYGKGYRKTAKMMSWMETKDPAGFIRAVAFHTKLGLFAVEQVFVQASQLINVMGITTATLGPQGAVRAMLGVTPMRIALMEHAPKAAVDRIAKIQAPFTGLSAEDFIKLRDWIKSTGRDVIARTTVEKNNPHSTLALSKFDSFIEAGQVPFNEGEKIARIGAAFANRLERKRLYPDEDIFDNRATDAMIHRQDVLAGSMTSASAAPWQRSLLAIPLQFTTYHVRMAEQIFTDRILKPKERASLGLAHVITYGAAGVPLAGAIQDRLGYTGAIDPETGIYDVVRFGAMDAMLGIISGEETALSARLAVGEGLFDLFTRIKDDGLFQTAAGPGGSIGFESFTAFSSMLGNVFSGKFDYLSYDWNRFARNVTSYDRAYTLWNAMLYGEYYSRKSNEVGIPDVSAVDTVLLAMGVPLAERELLWTTVGNQIKDDKMLKTKTKAVLRLDSIASDLLKEGKYEEASKVFEDIAAELEVLRPSDRDDVMFRLRSKMQSHTLMVERLIKDGKLELANKLQGYIR